MSFIDSPCIACKHCFVSSLGSIRMFLVCSITAPNIDEDKCYDFLQDNENNIDDRKLKLSSFCKEPEKNFSK